MDQILKISDFILQSFIHIWPYLAISIPLAVMVQLSGASKFIKKVFSKKPLIAILLATVLGAFSPFCSCGVIPIIATLLISGVPLAPVMSFWIASPSMDPEIFFLSTATVGWNLSVWRLAATFTISLLSGYITHFAYIKGLIGEEILRKNRTLTESKPWKIISSEFIRVYKKIFEQYNAPKKTIVQIIPINDLKSHSNINCCISTEELSLPLKPVLKEQSKECNTRQTPKKQTQTFYHKLFKETYSATIMVAKFMALAFFINALIKF